jgi:hypothetical protein
VPRAVGVEFPFGHPLGLPDQPEMQMAVIRDALRVLGEAEHPGTVVHLDHSWPGDYNHWRRAWHPRQPAPITELLLRENKIQPTRHRGEAKT